MFEIHVLQSIPVSFFKYLKGQKCERAILRGRTGKIWPVKINSRSFEDGWKDFVEDHDLHVGDFLVFRHEGEMVFDVMVFESSACLREYPSFPAKEFDIKEEEIEFQEEQLAQKSSPGKFIAHFLCSLLGYIFLLCTFFFFFNISFILKGGICGSITPNKKKKFKSLLRKYDSSFYFYT